MKKLDEFDEERLKDIEAEEAGKRKSIPNGIACPDCGKELLDTKPWEVTAGTPPRVEIHCAKKSCGFEGTRLAGPLTKEKEDDDEHDEDSGI